MLHQGDTVEEKKSGRQGKLNEAPRPGSKTDVQRWRVNFTDGKVQYFMSEDELSLVTCPHTESGEPGFVPARGIMN